MAHTLCPHDGAMMQRDTRPLVLRYKKHTETIAMPGWYCPECGEGIHSGKDMHVSDRVLHRMKAEAEGLLSAEHIRRIRKKLGLTQAEAGMKIGGGLRAFQKYESGDLLPSQGIDSALRLLDHDPALLFVLDERNTVKMPHRHEHESSRHT